MGRLALDFGFIGSGLGSTFAFFDPPNKESVARAALGFDFIGSVLGSAFAGFDPPNNDSVARAALGFDFIASGFGSTLAGFDPPNKESVERAVLGFDFTGAANFLATTFLATAFFCFEGVEVGAGGVFLGAGLKNENAGSGAFFAGAGEGAGAGADILGDGLKNENAGAFFVGAGAGFGAFSGVGASFFGAGLKNENAGAFFVGEGAGFGAGTFFGADFLKKEKDGAGAAFLGKAFIGAAFLGAAFMREAFLGAGGGVTTFFGFAVFDSKKDDRLTVGRGAARLLSGVEAFAIGFFRAVGIFGFCFSIGFVLGASLFSNNAAKLNVGLGWDAFGGFGEVSLVAGAVFGGCILFVVGFGISGLRFTDGFSFFFPKKVPNLTAGFEGVESVVDFSTTAASFVGGFGISGSFFGFTTANLSAMSFACFSSHSFALARAISEACS